MNWAIIDLDSVVKKEEIIPLMTNLDLNRDQYKEGSIHKKIGEIYYE